MSPRRPSKRRQRSRTKCVRRPHPVHRPTESRTGTARLRCGSHWDHQPPARKRSRRQAPRCSADSRRSMSNGTPSGQVTGPYHEAAAARRPIPTAQHRHADRIVQAEWNQSDRAPPSEPASRRRPDRTAAHRLRTHRNTRRPPCVAVVGVQYDLSPQCPKWKMQYGVHALHATPDDDVGRQQTSTSQIAPSPMPSIAISPCRPSTELHPTARSRTTCEDRSQRALRPGPTSTADRTANGSGLRAVPVKAAVIVPITPCSASTARIARPAVTDWMPRTSSKPWCR